MGRNKLLPLRIPPEADLTRVINWGHPLLKNIKAPTPEERVLKAWRRKPGFRFFFDRPQIDKIFQKIPGGDWRTFNRNLAAFLPKKDKKLQGKHRYLPGPVPRTPNGKLNWHCYTARDQEFVGGVNDMSWIVGMAAAARRNGRPATADAVFSVLDDWIENCPLPVDVVTGTRGVWSQWYTPWSPFRTGCRMYSWATALNVLWDSAALTPERFGRYVRSICDHMVYLGRVSPTLDRSAHANHLLMEMGGLLCASLLPWLRESRAAREAALHNIHRCFEKQVLPDGVHCERGTVYHRAIMQWFAWPFLLCKLNRWPLPKRAMDRLASMVDFGLHAVEPNSTPLRFGDGAVARPSGYDSEQLLAGLTGQRLPAVSASSREPFPFLQNRKLSTRTKGKTTPLAQFFPQGGFAAGRSSWNEDASSVLMKLDGWGGGHSHSDFFSFMFIWKGRLLINERGTRSYNNDRKAIECKYSTAHNVVLIGTRNMCAYADETRYSGHRPPIVRFTGIFAETGRNGFLKAGGKLTWPDGAWWRRQLEFNPRHGLTIHDKVGSIPNERVRIQFFVDSTHVKQTNSRNVTPSAFRTSDRGRPNIEISSCGSPHLKGKMLEDIVYDRDMRGRRIQRVEYSSRMITQGCWTTHIIGR